MKNLIKQAVVLTKANFELADMQSDDDHYFFKIDQVQTKGLDVIIVCVKDDGTVTKETLGDISLGANLMNSDIAGNRTILYTTDWYLNTTTDEGRIFIAAFVVSDNVDIANLKTEYFDLPFDEYDLLTTNNNFIPE